MVPELGGIINGLFLNRNGQRTPLLDYYDTADSYWKEIDRRFVNGVLAPYVNRLRGGAYTYRGHTFHFNELFADEPNSIHGLLLKKPFTVKELEAGEDSVRIVQSFEYKGDDSAYPFPFSLEQEIILNGEASKLSCSTQITNTGDSICPMGFGQHLYVNTGTPIDHFDVEFPGTEVLTLDNTNIPTGDLEPLPMHSNKGRLGDTQLDHTLVVDSENQGSPTSLKIKDPQKDLTVQLSFDPKKFGYLQLYTPGDRHAIGTEPMSCAPDAFNNGMGLEELEPSQTRQLNWEVEVIPGS